jgi:hypothetical protein
MKTSYFAKSGKDPNAVAICAYCPSWYTGKQYPALAPPWSLVSAYKKTGDKDAYEEFYLKHVLANLSPSKVIVDLGNSAILLCYENPQDFCHRHIVADWLRGAGFECEELV